MTPNYTLLSLPCWTCGAPFPLFTDLSNHHLLAHEAPLRGQPVAVWLARDVTARPEARDSTVPAPDPDARCACGCIHESHVWGGGQCQNCACQEFTQTSVLTIRCTCGCALDAHHAITAERPLQPCGACACRAFVLALIQPTSPPCFCGHAEQSHSQGYWRAPCQIPGCPCTQFTDVSGDYSCVQTFRACCAAKGLSYEAIDARRLLDRLQVPPDAPAEPYQAAIAEAVDRHRARQGGAA